MRLLVWPSRFAPEIATSTRPRVSAASGVVSSWCSASAISSAELTPDPPSQAAKLASAPGSSLMVVVVCGHSDR